jgi:DNA-binding beta-propeller fold protein YncE
MPRHRLWLTVLLLAPACHHRRPPELPVRPEQPPPTGVAVPPPVPGNPNVAPSPVPATVYHALATAESQDQVALIRFRPCQPGEQPPACGVSVERTFEVGIYPGEIEGPHGVVAAPNGKTFYVTLGHGRTAGRLEHYDLGTGQRLGMVGLGMFPATVDVAPTGALVYAANDDSDDPDKLPSSLSIVEVGEMREVARPETCRMPRGSRLNPQGTLHYSGCMMNDLLVEVDARTFTLRRLFNLVPGREGPVPLARVAAGMSSVCAPTWAQPSADGSRVYVACNKSAEIVEVNVAGWRLVKRWKTPAAPYSLAVTPDSRLLIATHQGPGTVTIWRLADDSLLAEIHGTHKVASGVAVSRDSRYAFVTLEGVGGDPGAIDIIDLKALRTVATVELGRRANGIGLLP